MTDRSGPSRFRGPVKWVTIVAIVLAVLVLLFTVVFPWIESNVSTPTMGG